MIAYNFAFAYSDKYLNEYKASKNEIEKEEIIIKTLDFLKMLLKNNEGCQKFNQEAIHKAMENGIKKYMEHPFIAHSYKEVGEVFTLN